MTLSRLCDVQSNQYARIIAIPQELQKDYEQFNAIEYSLIRIISAHHLIIFECKSHIFCIDNSLAKKIKILLIPS